MLTSVASCSDEVQNLKGVAVRALVSMSRRLEGNYEVASQIVSIKNKLSLGLDSATSDQCSSLFKAAYNFALEDYESLKQPAKVIRKNAIAKVTQAEWGGGISSIASKDEALALLAMASDEELKKAATEFIQWAAAANSKDGSSFRSVRA